MLLSLLASTCFLTFPRACANARVLRCAPARCLMIPSILKGLKAEEIDYVEIKDSPELDNI